MTDQKPISPPGGAPRRWFAAGGVMGAVLASSCCILPLALVTLGVSGAWIGSLRLLEPFKPVFLVVAAIFIGLGFYQVYFRPRPPCEDGSYCAQPQSTLITQVALWLAAALVALAATIDWWAKFFY